MPDKEFFQLLDFNSYCIFDRCARKAQCVTFPYSVLNCPTQLVKKWGIVLLWKTRKT
jgi:hypothetical protein